MGSNKYYSVTIPDLNYSNLFKSFLLRDNNYIAHLEKSNNKDLKRKYNIYKDDPVNGVEAFINYNNSEWIKKNKLFISRLYKPELRYDKPYNNSIGLIWDHYENQMASIQEQYLSTEYRKLIIDFLKAEKIISRVEFYYSASNTQFEGSKAKGYSLHPRVYSTVDFGFKTERLTISESLYNSFLGIGKNKAHKYDNYPEIVMDIKEQMGGWYLDESLIPDDLKQKYDEEIEFFKKGEYFTFSGYGSRFYSHLSGLPKVLRPYLRYENSDHEDFMMFDINNGAPFFLSILMLREELPDHNPNVMKDSKLDDEEIKKLKIACLSLSQEAKNIDVRNTISDILSGCINHSRKGMYKPENLFRELQNNVASFTYDDQLIQVFERYNKRVLLFILMTASGTFYESMAKGSNGMYKNGDQFKDDWKKIPNWNNDLFNNVGNDFLAYMNNCFPEVYKYLKSLKGKNYKNYGHQTNVLESEFTIQFLSKKLLKMEIPFFPIHDGLMFPKEYELDLFSLVFEYDLELPIPHTFEEIKKRNNYRDVPVYKVA